MNSGNFFAELKRRNVYKVAVAYAVIGWLLIQAGSILFPTFDAPGWVMKVFVAAIAAGFPIALVLAWAFELTPDGIQLTTGAAGEPRPKSRMRRSLFWSLVALGAVAGVVLSVYLVRHRSAVPVAPAGQPSGKRAVAVLPFENLSEDKANAYFADGMQDEIITRLAKVGDLKVISRTSTLPYRTKPEKLSEIARQLGVGHVVEGSVQKIGDRVRINVQLIEAATDDHLWAELYDRNVADVFAMQTEVATKIAGSLQAKLSGRERKVMAEKPTENMAAYDAYLRGIDFESRPGQTAEDQKKAIELFEEAVRLDPRFTHAWAALAKANAGLFFLQIDASAARKEAARKAAEAATRLDPTAVETLLANAYYRYHIERDYNGARELFEKIEREVSSSSATTALARIARRQSRWKESLRLYEQATKLNPRDPHLFMDRSWTFSMLRMHRETMEMIDRALAIVPDDADVLMNKVKALQVVGDIAGARAVLETVRGEQGADPTAVDSRVTQLLLERRYPEAIQLLEARLVAMGPAVTFESASSRQLLGWLRSLAGDGAGGRNAYVETKEQLEIVQREQPRNHFVVSALGFVEAGLGNKEAALREGERAMMLMPASEDAVYGPIAEETLAAIEAQVGEPERALARIERLLTTPYGAYPLTQATLRIDPIWDSLRQYPRFKALVEGPEPKTIYQ